jgi:hypothetical protein
MGDGVAVDFAISSVANGVVRSGSNLACVYVSHIMAKQRVETYTRDVRRLRQFYPNQKCSLYALVKLF